MRKIENILRAEERKAAKVKALATLLRDRDLRDVVTKLQFNDAAVKRLGKRPATTKPKPGVRGAILTVLAENLRNIIEDDSDPSFDEQTFYPSTAKIWLDDKFGEDAYSLKAIREALYYLARCPNPAVQIIQNGTGGRENEYERC